MLNTSVACLQRAWHLAHHPGICYKHRHYQHARQPPRDTRSNPKPDHHRVSQPYIAGHDTEPSRKDDAMFEPLLPLSFLNRATRLFPEQLAVVDGALRYTYRTLGERVNRLSNGLRQLGVA